MVGHRHGRRQRHRARRRRRARVRLRPAERLVGARHPGLRVPAARAVPGQELRHDDLAVGRHARRAGALPRRAARAGPAAGAAPGGEATVGPRPPPRGRAVRDDREPHVVRRHVLDVRPAAGPRHVERRHGETGRPARQRHGERTGRRDRGQPHRAHLARRPGRSRWPTGRAGPSSPMATRSRCAAGAGATGPIGPASGSASARAPSDRRPRQRRRADAVLPIRRRRAPQAPHHRPRRGGNVLHEELMGTEGFSNASALLYHRHSPSAIVAAEAVPDTARHVHPQRPAPAAPPPHRPRSVDGRAPVARCSATTTSW